MDRDNEVTRILGAFKLNPMEQLGLRFDASLEDIKRQYRKTSLLVHPDKCRHPRAQDAFEVLGHANRQLQDEGQLKELMYVLSLARGAPGRSVACTGAGGAGRPADGWQGCRRDPQGAQEGYQERCGHAAGQHPAQGARAALVSAAAPACPCSRCWVVAAALPSVDQHPGRHRMVLQAWRPTTSRRTSTTMPGWPSRAT